MIFPISFILSPSFQAFARLGGPWSLRHCSRWHSLYLGCVGQQGHSPYCVMC